MIHTGLDRELELFTRHIRILNFIRQHQPLGIINLARLLDMPQHKVRYSLRILEREGLIDPTAEGAVLSEKAESFYSQIPGIIHKYYETFKDIEGIVEA